MFTFGLFSTHLPYLALVLFSMFYFLFPAVKPSELSNNDPGRVEITLQLQPQQLSSDHAGSSWFFTASATPPQEVLVLRSAEKAIPLRVPDELPLPARLLTCSLFSRPPPLLS